MRCFGSLFHVSRRQAGLRQQRRFLGGGAQQNNIVLAQSTPVVTMTFGAVLGGAGARCFAC